jgi:DNA-binding MarR family transcriptional regulator
MSGGSVADSLERIVASGIALTTLAIAAAPPGSELTFPQWRVMVILAVAGRPMRMSQVARGIGVTLPAMSRQLRRMERRGLVAVSPDPVDRRASAVRLTDAGELVRAAIVASRLAMIAALTASLESEPGLQDALRRAADAMEQQA